MSDSPDYGAAIASVETGGEANPYTAVGPTTASGDNAYGKYQVMGNNIGPWSKEILGKEVTPQQFLADPSLQDQIFTGKFGQYVDKYGPIGASQAWFAGEKGMKNLSATDQLGTTVAGYGGKFAAALAKQNGAQPQPLLAAPTAAPTLAQPAAQPPAYPWSQPGAPAASAAPTSTVAPAPGQAPAQLTPQQAAMSDSPFAYRPLPAQPMQITPPAMHPNLQLLLASLKNAPASVRGLYSKG